MNENNGIVSEIPNVPNNSVPTSPEPVSPTTTPTISESNHPQWYTRFAAYLIDSLLFVLILLFPIFTLSVIFGMIAVALPKSAWLVTLLTSVSSSILLTILFSYFQSKSGQTWGMKFLGIKLNKTNGELLSFQEAFIRNSIALLPFGLLNGIEFLSIFSSVYLIIVGVSILIDKNHQGFHDKAVSATYSKLEENTKRAKLTIGIYCGCLTIFIGLFLAAFILGIGSAYLGGVGINNLMKNEPKNEMRLNNQDKKLENNMMKRDMNQKIEKETPIQINEMSNEEEITTQKQTELPESQSNNPEDLFIKSCMDAGKANPKIDLTDYCACSAKEYMKTQDINKTINACKNLVKTKY